MGPEAWRRRIGDAAFDHLVKTALTAGVTSPSASTIVALVLTQAVEVGFQDPGVAPTIDPRGTKVLWPGSPASLTAKGLAEFYGRKGHRWYLLKVDVLLAACAGPLLARLQEVLAAYEEECRDRRLPVLPVDLDDKVFVGGEGECKFDRVDLALDGV